MEATQTRQQKIEKLYQETEKIVGPEIIAEVRAQQTRLEEAAKGFKNQPGALMAILHITEVLTDSVGAEFFEESQIDEVLALTANGTKIALKAARAMREKQAQA